MITNEDVFSRFVDLEEDEPGFWNLHAVKGPIGVVEVLINHGRKLALPESLLEEHRQALLRPEVQRVIAAKMGMM